MTVVSKVVKRDSNHEGWTKNGQSTLRLCVLLVFVKHMLITLINIVTDVGNN
jgi:hypothetical protein